MEVRSRKTAALAAIVGVLVIYQGHAGAAGTCLLSASMPGAFALRQWPDRVVLVYETKQPVTVVVSLPQAVTWVRVGEKDCARQARWDRASGCVTLRLPAGAHAAQIGWSGKYEPPAQGQKIPVLLGSRQVGSLTCRFDLQRMTADGMVSCPLGLYSVATPADTSDLTLSLGGITVWQDGIAASRQGLLSDATPVSLVTSRYNLTRSPIRELRLQLLAVALEPKRLPALPSDGLVIEAEDYVAEGLGKVEVSTKHFGTRGGKSVFENSGDGHWLEYRFTIPRAGLYDLYVRAATTEPCDLRSLTLDGVAPPGLGLIQFPGTGGWGYAAGEWAALQLSGLPSAPSLKLQAGDHRLRLTGEGSTHLNLDYFLLVPR
jgi:hypothetical protein